MSPAIGTEEPRDRNIVTAGVKIVSGLVTAAALIEALFIGGGIPMSPTRMAASATDALSNLTEAQGNTHRATEDTAALARINRNVSSQLETSERMLGIQLRIEETSRQSVHNVDDFSDAIEGIRRALIRLGARLTDLGDVARPATETAEAAAEAAGELRAALAVLDELFDEVTDESRELNRKARGYRRLREGP